MPGVETLEWVSSLTRGNSPGLLPLTKGQWSAGGSSLPLWLQPPSTAALLPDEGQGAGISEQGEFILKST